MQLLNIEEASYQELRVVQDKLLELLRFYDSFCKQYNLKYWLAGGSMIGAIREEGIIPWDDDIDVFMPREDYERFVELFEKYNRDSHYALAQTTYEENYHFTCIGLHDLRTTFINEHSKDEDIMHGFYLDIMPMDYVATSGLGRFKQTISAILYDLFIVQRPARNQGKFVYFLTSSILSCVPGKAFKYRIAKFFEKQMIAKRTDKTTKMVELVTNIKALFRYHDVSIFDKTINVKFENGKFPVPIGYDQYLKACFGDYMSPPSEDSRKPKHKTVFIDTKNSYLDYKGIHYMKGEK
ncbi:lipopolysaccharide cholinephosphotransferase [Rodentibacter pneumotropicus]|uniref:LicD family protein n=1 Tax=Rodentibacter pneumotropicus TaxID=758 RepID=A0AAW5LCC7_9PAST|nr:LicD family protein [Rodentibacter pneumotropicus]MCQ9121683.1 LicD family protein [Rodentibacter pneumotropicus]OOF68576.1 lipopolysaccharide cholinephosphotransferase [Rodentibacter pneumotropicus]